MVQFEITKKVTSICRISLHEALTKNAMFTFVIPETSASSEFIVENEISVVTPVTSLLFVGTPDDLCSSYSHPTYMGRASSQRANWCLKVEKLAMAKTLKSRLVLLRIVFKVKNIKRLTCFDENVWKPRS